MIDFEAALAIVLEHSATLGTRTKPLSTVTGDVLAEHIIARNSIPPFDSSSMDGYALRTVDVANAGEGHAVTLAVVGAVHAGEETSTSIGRLKAVKIMTGAQIPRGADAVIMKEHVTATDGGIEIVAPVRPGSNIRGKGAEFRSGAIVLRSGTLITPPVAGLLATAGSARVRVFRKPRVALLVTGSELRSPGAGLKSGQIRDANSTALLSALSMLGVDSVSVTRVADSRTRIFDAIGVALRISDIVMTVGGISVGDRDYVREALHAHNVDEHFWRIAMKPGKPNFFGTKDKTLVFGLPGNPVSALLSFHVLVRPAIARIRGLGVPEALVIHARLAEDLEKKPGRLEFVRVRIANDTVRGFIAVPVREQESHMLSGLSSATGMYRFPKHAALVRKGKHIPVELLDWGWS